MIERHWRGAIGQLREDICEELLGRRVDAGYDISEGVRRFRNIARIVVGYLSYDIETGRIDCGVCQLPTVVVFECCDNSFSVAVRCDITLIVDHIGFEIRVWECYPRELAMRVVLK